MNAMDQGSWAGATCALRDSDPVEVKHDIRVLSMMLVATAEFRLHSKELFTHAQAADSAKRVRIFLHYMLTFNNPDDVMQAKALLLELKKEKL